MPHIILQNQSRKRPFGWWVKHRRWWWWNVNPPGPGDVRVTEDGEPRVTEDTLFLRVTEDAI